MTDESTRQRRAIELFEECADLPVEQRRRWLDEACGDPAVRAEVEELLRVEAEGAVMEPLFSVGDGVIGPPGATTQVGPYELGEVVGAGGMGEVYVGHRVDGAFDRTVAIKRMRPGIGSDEVESRFRRERRVLAALEHPNIARLLDAGADDDGVPYLVMEFIDGRPLDRYSDEQRLSVDDRIGLFLKVCDAVDHAHRVGVVHRDLKPANILVGADGEPKLLDFGIAGVLRSEEILPDLTLTAGPLGFMTPAYASPEQMRRGDVAAPSDQYSLGVILYELLAGRPPFDLGSLSPAEMERVISEDDPTPPSQALHTAGSASTGPAAETVGLRRGVGAATLSRSLRGDLDQIVAMALRKEPERRYASVRDLADDLRRYLDGRPVRAQRDTAWYRITRFVRRNRVPVVVAAIVFVAISTALVFALRERNVAREAQQRAEEGLADADAVTTFLTEMLASGDPYEMGRKVSVREVLDKSSGEVDARFGDRPLIAGRLHATMGRVYVHLDELDRATHHAEQACATLDGLVPPEDPRWRDALWALAIVRKKQGRYTESAELFQRIEVACRTYYGDHHEEVYRKINDRAGALRADKQYEEAERLFQQAHDGLRAVFGDDHTELRHTHNNLGLLMMLTHRYPEARRHLERSLELHSRVLGPNAATTLVTRGNLADLHIKEGRYPEAITELRATLVDCREHLGDMHGQTGLILHLLSRALSATGGHGEAVTLGEEYVAIRRALHGPRSAEVGQALFDQGEWLFAARDLDGAEECLYEAAVIFDPMRDQTNYARLLRALSVTNAERNRYPAAAGYMRRSLAILDRFQANDRYLDADAAHDIRRSLWDLAVMMVRAGDLVAAGHYYHRWLIENPRERVAGSARARLALKNLGAIRSRSDRMAEAEEWLTEAYIRTCDRFGPDAGELVEPLEQLVALYQKWGRPDEERAWSDRLRELRDGLALPR